MENHRIPPLNLAYYYQGKSIEELRHSLLCATLELETTRLAAKEEIRRKDDELKQLKDLLVTATREKDEANDKYQTLLLRLQQQQQQQQQQLQQHQQDDGQVPRGDSNAGISSSECEESIVSEPSLIQPFSILDSEATATTAGLLPLPEKGKLLQAVMKAGPLLQTLLLAGPLPQWRHPPPPLDTLEIPPVTIPGTALNSTNTNKDNTTNNLQQLSINIDYDNNNNNHNSKRSLFNCHGTDSSPPTTKYQRIILQ